MNVGLEAAELDPVFDDPAPMSLLNKEVGADPLFESLFFPSVATADPPTPSPTEPPPLIPIPAPGTALPVPSLNAFPETPIATPATLTSIPCEEPLMVEHFCWDETQTVPAGQLVEPAAPDALTP